MGGPKNRSPSAGSSSSPQQQNKPKPAEKKHGDSMSYAGAAATSSTATANTGKPSGKPAKTGGKGKKRSSEQSTTKIPKTTIIGNNPFSALDSTESEKGGDGAHDADGKVNETNPDRAEEESDDNDEEEEDGVAEDGDSVSSFGVDIAGQRGPLVNFPKVDAIIAAFISQRIKKGSLEAPPDWMMKLLGISNDTQQTQQQLQQVIPRNLGVNLSAESRVALPNTPASLNGLPQQVAAQNVMNSSQNMSQHSHTPLSQSTATIDTTTSMVGQQSIDNSKFN